ncbi:tyrosine-type recombinase/integrase [Anaerovibrio sp. RM50]|uniref:tyrosine-type recombinase/integrase n=1 Tax=Anaerovibrio sp. RM50 TaxID=1200557 RepID=UPI0006879C83|nr:tyrosine-type recombinase/integrase [Anaerovibrio sp. RM50]
MITEGDFIHNLKQYIIPCIAKGNPSADTLEAYIKHIGLFLKWCQKNNRQPLKMTEQQIRIYYQELMDKGYKPLTIHIKISALKALYRAAVSQGLIFDNPCNNLRTQGGNPPTLRYYLDMEQLQVVCNAYNDEADEFVRNRNTLILYLFSVEGLRPVDIFRLNIQDIDWQKYTIVLNSPGSGDTAEPQEIYPCQETINVLMDYINSIPPSIIDELMGKLAPLIISNSKNNFAGRLSRNGMRLIINNALNKTGLKISGSSANLLRNSCGTNLFKATNDIKLVQKTLRQQSLVSAMKYMEDNPTLSRRATNIIAPKREK